jgi:O-antigen/teichoic acid export membrane protein
MGSDGEGFADTYTKGVMYVAGSNTASKVFGVLFTILIANFFVSEQSDLFFEAIAFMIAVSSLSNLGLGIAANKFIPKFMINKEYSRVRGLVLISIVLIIIATFISISIIANIGSISAYAGPIIKAAEDVASRFGFEIDYQLQNESSGVSEFMGILTILTIVYVIFGYMVQVLNSMKRFAIAALSTIGYQSMRFFAIAILVLVGMATAMNLLQAYVAIYALLVIFFSVQIILRLPKAQTNIDGSDIKSAKDAILFGFPLYISSAIELFITQMDVLLIAFFMRDNPGVVSGYMVTVLIVRNIGPVISGPMMQVQLPILVEEIEKKSENFHKLVRQTSRWIAIIGMPVLAFFMVAGGPLFSLMAPKYVEYSYLIWWFAPFVIMTLFVSSIKTAFFSSGFVRQIFMFSILFAGMNLLLDILLIPVMGVSGAALASSTSATITGVGMILYFRHRFSVWIPFDMVKALMAGVVAVGTGLVGMFLLNSMPSGITSAIIQIITTGVIISVCYLISIILLKTVREKDWNLAFRFARKRGLNTVVDRLEPLKTIIVNYTG